MKANLSREVDVAVIGSGGAGMAAALTAHDRGAEVVVLERAEVVGGTTAMSAGVLWVPGNHLMEGGGADDSREAARHLESLSLGAMDPALTDAFLDAAPRMVRWFLEHTPLRLRVARGYPDYHPEHPGARPEGGRSLDCELFSFDELQSWRDLVRSTTLPLRLTVNELMADGGMAASRPEVAARRERLDLRGMGQALAGSLLRACLDRRIPIVTGARARELTRADGKVSGVRVERGACSVSIRTRKAVVLASGGFAWNPGLVRAFLRGPMSAPLSAPECDGDGLLMSMSVGAALGNMSEAWWAPAVFLGGDPPRHAMCVIERTLPGSIMVNRSGRRFVNEAANYNDLGRAFHAFDPNAFAYPNASAWLVFDERYRTTYPFVGFGPGGEVPPFVESADSIEGLAGKLGVDPSGLAATLQRFNGFAGDGADRDFGRGESLHDRFHGDRRHAGARATLGALDRPPFHAAAIFPGAIGTKGGPRTDPRGRVLDTAGRCIPGLYAVGNAMAGITGLAYAGAGATLGLALTFGYLAGADAASHRAEPACAARETGAAEPVP